MSRKYRTSRNFDKILDKLQKKNKQLYESIFNKINEILKNPNIEHYKNLRYNLEKYKRVHVGSFVIVFQYDKKKDIILFDDFDHHDKIYKK